MGNNSLDTNKNTIESLLVLIYLLHVVVGLFLMYYDDGLLHNYLTEDGYIEYATFFLLFMLSIICFYKGRVWREKTPATIFYFAAGLLFFFGAGEEISWGQRLLGFSTPENIRALNTQEEFTLHNLEIYGIGINKLIFGKILYSFLFIYFFVFPFLYRLKPGFRRVLQKVNFPIPKLKQSILYLILFLMIMLLPGGTRRWDFQEFLLSGFLLLVFIFPQGEPDHVSARLQEQHH